MDRELERIWKEVSMAYILAFPGVTEENHEKPVKTAGLWTDIQTKHLPNMSLLHSCYTNLSGTGKCPCGRPRSRWEGRLK
jgi:hypothetical protein